MNVRLTFLLVAVVVLFGGTVLALKLTHQNKSTADEPWLYRIDDGAIIHIRVTSTDQTVNYDKKPGSESWYIQSASGGPDVPVFLEKWSGTTLLLSGPKVNRKLADTIDNPAAYGLDPPQTSITVTERSGPTYEFHLGNTTPDGQNQYARLVGSPKLFTVPEVWARVINNLATKPPYPPPPTAAPGSG